MKKKFLLFTMMLAACAAVGSAQTMVVVGADGTRTKFNTDYIEEVVLEDVEPTVRECEFTSLTAKDCTKGNVMLTFATADGKISLDLDIYGAEDATYLAPGTYKVDASKTIPYIGTTYSSVLEGKNVFYLSSGQLDVKKNGTDYEMTMDFVLEDGSLLKGTYKGKVEGYGGSDEEEYPSEFVATQASYSIASGGEFYVKFNDTDWSFESAFDFFADDKTGTELPVGTYTYSGTDNVPGTFGPSSYIENANPYKRYEFATGSTITVAKDGNTYDIYMTLKTTDGKDVVLTFNGEIEN